MADRRKTASTPQKPTPQKPAASQQKAAPVLSEHLTLHEVIGEFVRANCNFESSLPVDAAIDDIGKSHDLNQAFAVPLRRQLFSMSTALSWVVFLRHAPGRAAQEDNREPFGEECPFDSQEALKLLESVYDIGMQEVVWDHFGDEDDEDEDVEDVEDDAGEGVEGDVSVKKPSKGNA